MEDYNLLKQSYIDRKTGGGSNYNYDLLPLINNFSFYEFISNGMRNSEHSEEYGGFLVITDKQYILGYNAGFGVGTHICSYARTMKELKGGGNISTDKEALILAQECKSKFITARIVYEKNYSQTNSYSGCISFKIDENGITENQLLLFEKFYNDYNEEIKMVSNRQGNSKFNVALEYKEGDKNKTNISNSLDGVYEYLKKHVNSNKLSGDNEVIIGTTLSKQK